jgi:putative ABC transport system permease protein
VGALLGIPGGIALIAAVGDSVTLPPAWQLIAVVPSTMLVVACLTAVPALLGARRPVAATLQSELA